jgi:hypothetical protein
MSRRKLKNQLKGYTRNKYPTPGLLGDYSRNVEVSGRANYVYVRLAGNILTQAFNNRVPNKYDRRVFVGYDPHEPHLLQVLGLQSDAKIYGDTTKTESQMMLHHASHEWNNSDGGNDVVFTELRQFMPLRPMPYTSTGTSVFVARGVGWIGSQWQYITGQSFDIVDSIPSTGCSYGLLYVQSNGLLNFTGSVVKDANTLTLADIPAPLPGTLPIAAIRMYGGQTVIGEAKSSTDLIDLRFPMAHDHKFRELSDVPRSYAGQTGKFARVNSTETGMEFINITGGSLGIGHIIADEGTPLAQRGTLNFTGAGVTAIDGTSTNINIPGTISIYDEATFKVSGTALNFGDGLLVAVTGTTAYIDWTGTYGHVLQNDGVAQIQRNGLNFVGNGFAVYDSADATIVSGTSTDPAGSDTHVQYNDGGAFGGDANFTWDKTTKELTVGGDVYGKGSVIAKPDGASSTGIGLINGDDTEGGAVYTLYLKPFYQQTADHYINFPDADFTFTSGGTLNLGGYNISALGDGTVALIGPLNDGNINSSVGFKAYPGVAGKAGIELTHNYATATAGEIYILTIVPANLTANRTHTLPNYTITWPTNDGHGYLHSDGAGALTWSAAAGGGHEIQDDGVAQTTRAALNFVGTNFAVYDSAGATIVSGTVGATSVPAWTENIDGALATGTDVAAYVAPGVGTIVAVYIRCKNTGSVGSTIVDVHKNGTTIFTTQASRPTLPFKDADGVAKSGTPDVTTVSENDVFTFDIDNIATGAEDLSIGLAVEWVSLASIPIKQTALFTYEGVLTVSDNPLRIYNQTGSTHTISKVFIAVNTAPTGANSILVDIHKDGTTIFTTQSNRPAITASNFTGVTTTIEVPAWADGSYLTMHLDQIGSTIAGSNLTVHVIYT